jgi:hypothetical protein
MKGWMNMKVIQEKFGELLPAGELLDVRGTFPSCVLEKNQEYTSGTKYKLGVEVK